MLAHRCTVAGGLPGLAALALFATAAPYVIFASEVKPYSFDVAVAMLLLWLALDLRGLDLSVQKRTPGGNHWWGFGLVLASHQFLWSLR